MKKNHINEYVVLLVLDVMLIVLFLWLHKEFLLFIALGLSFFGVVVPPLRKAIAFGFRSFSGFTGRVITLTSMIVFFVLILTPIAFLKKTSNKNHNFRTKPGSNSAFIKTGGSFKNSDFEKLW